MGIIISKLDEYRAAMSEVDWDRTGLPVHCPMPVDVNGNGPTMRDDDDDDDFHHWTCWCPDGERCTAIFEGAWAALAEVTR